MNHQITKISRLIYICYICNKGDEISNATEVDWIM